MLGVETATPEEINAKQNIKNITVHVIDRFKVYPRSTWTPKACGSAAPKSFCAGAGSAAGCGPLPLTSCRQPPCGGVGAVLGPRVEGNRRGRGGFMNRVDDGFEEC